MDAKLINPFLNAIMNVLPQLGFPAPERKNINIYSSELKLSGVVMILGIVGDKKGNVSYNLDFEGAKKIASTMMMGMEVKELDDMSKSALSELSNMLTANAMTNFSDLGLTLDISVPTLLSGEDFSVDMGRDKVLGVDFEIGDIKLTVYVEIS